MLPQLELTTIRAANEDEQRQHGLIQDYLDHLCAPLVGILPYDRRREIRLEAEGHLYALVEEQRETGRGLGDATVSALTLYGAPHALGQAIVDSWLAGEGTKSRPATYMRMAVLRAFACFSTPAALSFLLIEDYVLAGAGADRLHWILVWLFIAPVLAGALSGWIIPTRSARAVLYANAILLVQSTLISFILLPDRQGFDYTLFQICYGLPVSTAAACFVEALHRHLRRTSFRALVIR